MKKYKNALNKVLFAVVAMIASAQAFALGGSGADTSYELTEIRDLATMLQAWLAGDLGILIVMLGAVIAAIMILTKASLMPALFVVGLAIFLGWAPAIFIGILSVETVAVVATGGA